MSGRKVHARHQRRRRRRWPPHPRTHSTHLNCPITSLHVPGQSDRLRYDVGKLLLLCILLTSRRVRNVCEPSSRRGGGGGGKCAYYTDTHTHVHVFMQIEIERWLSRAETAQRRTDQPNYTISLRLRLLSSGRRRRRSHRRDCARTHTIIHRRIPFAPNRITCGAVWYVRRRPSSAERRSSPCASSGGGSAEHGAPSACSALHNSQAIKIDCKYFT